jgi:hypothetical protein
MGCNKALEIIQSRRICAIGGYETYRYIQLGFHWDGQVRAFKELGYNSLFLDIRKDTYENLRRKILDFSPDILWLGLKECLPFVRWMGEDLEKIGCKVIFWFCDLRGIEGTRSDIPPRTPVVNPEEIGSFLDYIFLSNAGQVEDYQKAYNTETYYMPQACTPAFMHRLDLPERYDIGFAGSLGGRFHTKRTKLLKKLSRKYKTEIKNNVRNSISNFYSKCRIVVGINPDFVEHLYTSSRFFVATGCGAFYLCEWFPGIEKLVENHRHAVWFKTEKELFELIDYYLEHNEKREQIRRNAQLLAHSNHTYRGRIQNMMDIIDGKTNQFHGFLEGDKQ